MNNYTTKSDNPDRMDEFLEMQSLPDWTMKKYGIWIDL